MKLGMILSRGPEFSQLRQEPVTREVPHGPTVPPTPLPQPIITGNGLPSWFTNPAPITPMPSGTFRPSPHTITTYPVRPVPRGVQIITAPKPEDRPDKTKKENEPEDPQDPNRKSCAQAFDEIRRYTRAVFKTRGDLITDATVIP